MYLARVFIQLKPTVNDPQGQTIQGGLRQLGFDSVKSVRAGKYMEIRIDEQGEDDASRKVQEMCDKLLANPVIEDYRFELEQVNI
jgi:phosphoribosylformylglycinamidine synthase PurS subunit